MKTIIKYIVSSVLLLLVSFIMLFGSGFSAYAAEEFKTVLEELKSDPNFNESDYPDKIDDYNLYVMQIAETGNKELILYVYQPSHIKYDLQATKISLSYGFSKDGKNLTPKLYPLKLLDTEGGFDKYLVSNYEVPTETKRYYNIISIFRQFNTLIDSQTENYGDFTDISISIGQQWYAYDINDSVAYEMNTFNTMLLNTSIVGNFKFDHGFNWGNLVGEVDKGDCWFIAFDCPDYVIKHIYDADMSYTQQQVDTFHLVFENKIEYGEIEYKTITLTDKDTMTYKGDGLFAREYQWNRILSSSKFITNIEKNKVDISDEVKQTIKSSQWVFTFVETERTENDYGGSMEWRETYYDIFDVGILRLHFLDMSGKTYDLGVVNSLFNPDNIPDGYGTIEIIDTITNFFQKLFAILGIVALALILMFFSNLLMPFITILKEILKAIKYVLSLPFKIIKWIFKR